MREIRPSGSEGVGFYPPFLPLLARLWSLAQGIPEGEGKWRDPTNDMGNESLNPPLLFVLFVSFCSLFSGVQIRESPHLQ